MTIEFMTPELVEAAAAVMERPRRPNRVRVLVADPDPFARRLIQEALQAADEIVVIAGVSDAREALELSRHFRPELLLVDMALPDGGAAEVAREIARIAPGTEVAVLSAQYDEDSALAALRAGAIGYLSKEIEPAELREVVVRITNGEAVIPPTLARRTIECLREVPDSGWRPVRSRLTSREWEIVELLRAGASTERIADRLVLSRSTVYSHVKSLLRKLGVHSRCDAVAVAERLRREEAVPPE
jgi:DNA-binding NarL/FixJ family response regulator